MIDEQVQITEKIPIQKLNVSAYTIPTDAPEADGTIAWKSTTMILVELEAGGRKGIGYTYAHPATASVIHHTLKDEVIGKNILQDLPAITQSMIHAVRNNGMCGITMMAISAVDTAMWDLKAKLFNVPLATLLGQAKDAMLIYGSGGFTSYTNEQLQDQLGGWAEKGIKYVKMKIGTHPEQDVERVRIARKAIGRHTGLFVDANGAYNVKQALEKAQQFQEFDVTWFEEPVPSIDLKGLQFIREHVQPEMNIAAGEYGYTLPYFQAMLQAGAVDILQADATRCGGISGFLKAGYLCEAYQLPFSAHCAPSLHLHAAVALPAFFISEYFHDHVRIEHMLFDGTVQPKDGLLYPDLSMPGMGLAFKYEDAEKYKL